ncbi:AbrB family transcriptional regulator [Proteinivorax hydrogeniformans]|uniref:AbrB family transcriptional regulator n=1 Tax=Proteinivorax hydrogeniformans TaxID=1826727 RepID=A0AAU8HRU0_9FIRM
MLDTLTDTGILVILAIVGWLIFKLLKLPVPSFLGTLTVIGGLRAAGLDLPFAPAFIAPLVQTLLGIYMGAKIDRETIKDLINIIKPAAIIASWSIATVFVLGIILYKITSLDLYTAILSSSMGGLPEMTIIAMDTDSDLGTIIVMHMFKIIVTITFFPIFINYFAKQNGEGIEKKDDSLTENNIKGEVLNFIEKLKFKTIKQAIASIIIAAAGGYIFISFGVPAGVMVGAMLFTGIASLSGLKVIAPSGSAFNFLLLGVGITVADNITRETVDTIVSGELLFPLLISSIFVFGTSYLIALVIHKISKWDFVTCLLAAAPGGFTIMTTLAIQYDKDPFRVSMLHLCRIMIIKFVVPFAFMFLL